MPMNAKFKPPSVSRRGRQPQRITGISRPMDPAFRRCESGMVPGFMVWPAQTGAGVVTGRVTRR